jgi:hypothetical protein
MRARKAKAPAETWTGQTLMPHAPKSGRVESEASVLKRVMEALWAAGGVEVMRNNVGGVSKSGRFIRYGLGKSSSDLVCIVAPYGRWLCLEVKRGDGGNGVEEEDQRVWLTKMRNFGAVADFCTTPERALELVAEARKEPTWKP